MEEQLYQACEDGKVEEVRKLLQNSQININWQNQNDDLRTPLNIACQKGHLDIVKLLLKDEKIEVDKATNYGATPFNSACYNGHLEIVKLLLNDERVDVNKAANDGWTSLWSACVHGHIEIVKLLLNDQRVDVNKAGNVGFGTPFYVACRYGRTVVVKYLLERGREIDINKKNNNGKTGLDIAREEEKTDIVELIESFQKNPNETRERLKKEYAELSGDEKPLWNACRDGEVEEVRKLLQNSQINIDWQNHSDSSKTPFYIACEKGHIEIVKLLLNDKRVDIDNSNGYGATPFSSACYNGHLEIVKLLLNNERVNVNKAANDGWTSLWSACANGHIEITKLLLNDKRVDVNKAGNVGFGTPFYVACQYGRTVVVKYLLECGREIDINKKNSNGKTGLDIARENGNTDIVELIESFQKRKLEESKRSTYEIEYNTKTYRVKTTAKTLSDLENDIKSKLKLQSDELVLEFKDKGKYIILQDDDMEDLEDGMIIKVSTQPHQNVNKIDNSKPKPSVFLTHTWVKDELNRENHSRVATVNKLLKAQGFQTWFDEDKMEGHIDQKMAEGIDDSEVILVFITKTYMEKLNSKGQDNCKAEFTYATTRNKKMISVVMEPCMKNPGQWEGPLGIRLAGDLYVDMSETDSEFNISTLVERLQRK